MLTLSLVLLLAAFILFVIAAWQGKSLVAAGLACATASALVPLLS